MTYILVLSYYQGTILHRIMINLLNNSVGGRYWFSFMLAHGLCRAASFRGNSISDREPTQKRTNTFPPQNYLVNWSLCNVIWFHDNNFILICMPCGDLFSPKVEKNKVIYQNWQPFSIQGPKTSMTIGNNILQ